MSRPPPSERLCFLAAVVARERELLADTDARLFAQAMSVERAASLRHDGLLAERVDAFVARFARLQDTLGDKLLPALLDWLGEPVGPAIDNLARAERFGWVTDADRWMTLRRLRNQMIHEYVQDPAILADALQAAHTGIADLNASATALLAELPPG